MFSDIGDLQRVWFLIRLLQIEQSDLDLHCLPGQFCETRLFEILEHLP